jgi:UDP-N-acetyl-D-glucosamine dehydrogenase
MLGSSHQRSVKVLCQGNIAIDREVSGLLRERIALRDGVRVGVIGLGYVGLPLAIRFSESGFSVVGVDIKESLIACVQSGKSPLELLTDDEISNVVIHKRTFKPILVDRDVATLEERTLRALLGLDIFIVCVQTPLYAGRGWEPDTVWISKAADLIRQVHLVETQLNRLPRERLVVLESTTYPGTTREVFSPLLTEFKRSGILPYLAYSPERSNPGPKENKDDAEPGRDAFKITRVVGGLDEASEDTAVALYRSVFDSVYKAESLEAAEMMKLIENTFRFVSIGFANEMARIARTFGLDIWELIKGAKSKGFGLDLCYPGLIGGHCIPIDPHYLGWAVRNRRQLATFVDVAEKAHQDIRQEAVDLIQRILNERGKGLPGASILFLGIAYKKNVGDMRESGILDVMKRVYALGAQISFWDPVRREHHVGNSVRVTFTNDECRLVSDTGLRRLSQNDGGRDRGRRYFEPEELIGTWKDLQSGCISRFDCVVISTDHDVFHDAYSDLIMAEEGPAIVDLRNAIGSWMREKSSAPENGILRAKLKERRRYMLLGVH